MPILYVKVDALSQEESDDDVVELIRNRQWVDWRKLRLDDENSPAYRQAVNSLAIRLSTILESAMPITLADMISLPEPELEPGYIEIMAAAEEAIPEWQKTFEAFTEATYEVLAGMHWATEEIHRLDQKRKGFAGRLRVAREIAERIKEPAEPMSGLGTKYSNELVAIDPAATNTLQHFLDHVLSREEQEQAREFRSVMRGLTNTLHDFLPGLQQFI